jgi:hypothetical protein
MHRNGRYQGRLALRRAGKAGQNVDFEGRTKRFVSLF